MTEAQFQATRKVMQSANVIRGLITAAKGDVAKWTAIEDGHRNNLRPGQADGAKKCLDKAIAKLAKLRKQFADVKLPDENAAPPTVWIVAFCNDSYNYLPKEIPSSRIEEAKKEGLQIHASEAGAQSECDQLNSL